MKLKKIIFAVFCAAILLCTGVVCLASADDEGISTCSTSNYSYSVSYNSVSLRAQGFSGAPASITQIVNPSSTGTDYYGTVDVSRYDLRRNKYVDSSGANTIVKSGKVLTGQIAQNKDYIYRYEHSAELHKSDLLASPIAKTLYKEYIF